ncbi:MAG: transmembrane 220 family protein [Calditrichia bacterium]
MTSKPSLLLAIAFLIFAVIQFNDPDPMLWVMLYSAAAAVCALDAFGRFEESLTVVMFGVCFATAVFYAPAIAEWLTSPDLSELYGEMKAQKPFIEETRESLGALIAATGCFYVFHKNR